MSYININGKVEVEMSSEMLAFYNSLVGNTPFSFFQCLDKPVIVFDYYERFANELINALCNACNTQCECSVEYFPDPNVDAVCSFDGKTNKILIFEGALLAIYRFASILSCGYRTTIMKKESSDVKYHKFIVHSITNKGNIIDTSILLSDSVEENIMTDYIAMIAMKIIIAHEIGHLLSGHMQFRQKKGERSVKFAMGETNSCLNNLVLQVMEIDADQFAACQIMTILENELLNNEELKSILIDQKQIYRLVGCAIQCVFYLIGIKNDFWETDDPSMYSHPPALTRVNLFLDIMRLQMGKEREHEWAQIVNGVIIAQKNIYAHYGTDYSNPIKFVADIMGTNSYGSYLLEEWRRMKPEFSAYSSLPFL